MVLHNVCVITNVTVKRRKKNNMKPVDKKKNPGLAKLPTAVRNKMGFMKKGGMVKKSKMKIKKKK